MKGEEHGKQIMKEQGKMRKKWENTKRTNLKKTKIVMRRKQKD